MRERERLQAADRAWLMMAMISAALSEHPLIKRSTTYRRLADRARKALFDLYRELEGVEEPLLRPSGRLRRAKGLEDKFGEHLLQLKGTVSPDVDLELGNAQAPTAKRRRRRKS